MPSADSSCSFRSVSVFGSDLNCCRHVTLKESCEQQNSVVGLEMLNRCPKDFAIFSAVFMYHQPLVSESDLSSQERALTLFWSGHCSGLSRTWWSLK